jgi:cytochrome bd-type quinol oxidase subunit 1
MDKNQAEQTRKLWLLVAVLLFGFGVGGGISKYSDHGLTIPVLMQLAGGLIGSIFALFAFFQARKK